MVVERPFLICKQVCGKKRTNRHLSCISKGMPTWNHYLLCDPRYIDIRESARYVGRTEKPVVLRLVRHIDRATDNGWKYRDRPVCQWLRELVFCDMLPIIIRLDNINPALTERDWIRFLAKEGCALLNEPGNPKPPRGNSRPAHLPPPPHTRETYEKASETRRRNTASRYEDIRQQCWTLYSKGVSVKGISERLEMPYHQVWDRIQEAKKERGIVTPRWARNSSKESTPLTPDS